MCAQTVIGQRSAGNGPNGLSYDYYYYYYYYYYLRIRCLTHVVNVACVSR